MSVLGVLVALTLASQPPTSEAGLSLIEQAHQPRAIEIISMMPVALHESTPEVWREKQKLAPGVVPYVDPVSGKTLYPYFSIRTVYDGRGNLRIEQRNRTYGGPPELTTDITIFSPTSMLTRDSTNAVRVGYRRLSDSTVEARIGADRSYPTLVAFAVARLRATGVNITEDPAAPGAFALTSNPPITSGALRVTADGTTGEVLEVRFRDKPDAETFVRQFSGRMDSSLLPARFPRQRLNFRLPENTPFDAPVDPALVSSIEYYESASLLPGPPAADLFDWKSLAPEREDLATGEVITRSGKAPSTRARPLRPPAETAAPIVFTEPVKDASNHVAPPAARTTALQQIIYAAAAACIIGGIALWLQRRFSWGVR